jgi:hypothetical protein
MLAARGPQPILHIGMENFGYLAPPTKLTLSGDASATVNFVDATHLLLTFTTRSLLKRLPNEPPDDRDSSVAALLLELPSGKLLARTEWRLHDHQQYLWPLGHGHFLLRIRRQITLIAPLARLASGDAFAQTSFLQSQREIALMSVSPDADLLIVESMPPRKALLGAAASAAALAAIGMGDAPADPPPPEDVQINFYRLLTFTEPAGEDPTPHPVPAGALRTDGLVSLPVDADGYLDLQKESPHTWDFDFFSHSGSKLELAPFDTSCAPRPAFVSRSEFIAFGCRGSADRVSLGGFNMKGEQMWVQSLSTGVRMPFLASAPATGRFAMSRLLFPFTPTDLSTLLPDQFSGQEITVTQTWNGQELFRLQVTPIQRTGQNFDLSPDGLTLVLLREGYIELFQLPGLTDKDRVQIAKEALLVPEKNDAEIRLASRSAPSPERKPGVITVDPEELSTEPLAAAPPAEPSPPRQAPSLYGPGEQPASQEKSQSPN